MKPEIGLQLDANAIQAAEERGIAFKMHEGKKIIGKVRKDEALILFLEDGTEVMADNDGNPLQEWPMPEGSKAEEAET